MEDGKKRKLEEDGEKPITRDDIKAYLEPLSKEQLIGLLIDAGLQFPPIADKIQEVASTNIAHRKLFVRGLAWETTTQALIDAFKQYGPIEEGAVITDKSTGKSRGFGFITFTDMKSARKALQEPSKTIDGRITVCNLASAGSTANTGIADQAQRKLYIGGLSYETSNETLLSIFSQYGEIEEGAVAYDKNTNKSRGFAFVTYKTVEAAKRAIDDPNKTIEGRHVIVKLAAEGQKEKQAAQPSTTQAQQGPAPGYSVVNPNIPAYARPPVPAIGFLPYTPGLPAAPYGMPYGGQYAAQYGMQAGQDAAGGYYTGS